MVKKVMPYNVNSLKFWDSLFGKSTVAKGNADGYVSYLDFIKVLDNHVINIQKTSRINELNNLITRLPINGFGEQDYILNLNGRDILSRINEIESEYEK